MEYSKKIQLKVNGLKKPVRLVHITDCHISQCYENSTEEEIKNDARASVQWRPEGMPRPIDSLRYLLKEISSDQPALAVMTGDIVDLPLPGFNRALEEALTEAGVPYLYTFGNHENRGFIPVEKSKEKYYPMYSHLMNGSPDFQLIGFDENGEVCTENAVLYVLGFDDSTKIVTEEQMTKLKKLSAEGKPIILCLHIPIATEENTPAIHGHWKDDHFLLGAESDCETTHEFCSFVKSEESNVIAVLAGHIHFAHESEFAPGRKVYAAAPGYTQYAELIEICGE